MGGKGRNVVDITKKVTSHGVTLRKTWWFVLVVLSINNQYWYNIAKIQIILLPSTFISLFLLKQFPLHHLVLVGETNGRLRMFWLSGRGTCDGCLSWRVKSFGDFLCETEEFVEELIYTFVHTTLLLSVKHVSGYKSKRQVSQSMGHLTNILVKEC